MIVDCHVHVCATTPGHGKVSRKLADSLLFRFMRWRLGLPGGYGEELERAIKELPRDKEVVQLYQKLAGADPLPGERGAEHR